MGYRIEYDLGNRTYEVRREKPCRISLFLAVAFALILLLAVLLHPDGALFLQSLMIPGEDAVTVQAFQNMTDDLRCGARMGDALESFCRFVIRGE